MPEITYFDARGRAEPIRLCYALKGVQWTEIRPDRHVMHTDKETYPYGQVIPPAAAGYIYSPLFVYT
eukprot:COSAG02_NODE_49_length_45106_cov_298.436177_35_plen_67_part_00